jgi:thiol-disulfide isomerase/thioredoxin
VAVAGLAAAAAAQEKPGAEKPAGGGAVEGSKAGAVAPEAQRVLDRVKGQYEGAKGVTVRAAMKVSMKIHDDEQKQEQSMAVAAERPNKLAARPEGDEADQFALVSDGQTYWLYLGEQLNKYQTGPAPKTFGELMELASMGNKPEGMALVMQPQMLTMALLDWAPIDGLVKGAQTVTYGGKEEGKVRVRVQTREADIDLWVPAEGDAWVTRIKPDMSRLAGEGGIAPDITIDLDWAKKAEFGADAFAFKPPEGAEKVASLTDAMRDQMAGGGGEDKAHEKLLGAAAPAVELDLLDGGKLSLADYKGKVVVLDFWATWCPPCVEGLPVVSKIAADLKDKGVVFFAVNQQESPETIRKFLEKKGLKIPVALDKGKAARAYAVSGIPQTVLIGKDGTVQAVHVGYDEEEGKKVAAEMKKLAAGEKLAPEKKGDEPKGGEKK